jgi:SAM-dependent methyltransferase
MGVWADQVVPRLAEASLRSREIGELRREACAPLAGRVLELGFGSGLNVRWYPPAVTSVAAVEPSDVAWRMSERRRARTTVPIERRGLDGQRLEEADASYDAVLTTFTLCTIPEVDRALAEVRRVLRPGGLLCFLEHGLAPDQAVAAWQRRLEPMQRRLAGGCHLTRAVPELLQRAGLTVVVLQSSYLPGPRIARPWTYGYLGSAKAG